MNLTEEQQLIADAPPNAKLLVTAGPGTGKTHTLIARLAALIEKHDLSPASEVLVLSFSRAAVREIRERLKNSGGDARYVRAYTLDSFATRLLSEVAPEGEWQSGDFDARIRAATVLLQSNDEAREAVEGYLHIMVDEVQDLVDDRAAWVQAILGVASEGPGGWTLLGDPAQGIYNFQLEGEARALGSKALYKWLRERFAGQLQEHTLSQNHRAQSSSLKPVLAFGPRLNAAKPDHDKIRYDLDDVLLALPDLGDLKKPAAQNALRRDERTAILCRTNGQALMLSRHLHEQGIAHRLQRGASDRALPAWIGALLHDFEGRSIGKSAFADLCAERLPDADANSCFRALSRFVPGRNKHALDVSALSSRLLGGQVPDELCEQPSGTLTVSTVHRAKGLEFDRVVVVWSPSDMAGDDELNKDEEARVLYVALTRPRRSLLQMPMLEFKGSLSRRNPAQRWTRCIFRGPNQWWINDIEVGGPDAHSLDPTGGFLIEADAKEAQDYISCQVKLDDLVVLEQIEAEDDAGRSRVHYAILHGGRPVGVTDENFCWAMHNVLKRGPKWEIAWPRRIENLRVEAVDTVAGEAASGVRCGLGTSGLWLRVRVAGMGKLAFRDE